MSSQRRNESTLGWLLLLVIGGSLFYLSILGKGCNAPLVTAPVEKLAAPVEKVTTEVAKAVDKQGVFLSSKLPDGIELNIPEFGIERQLIAFIEDKTKPVDKTTWFGFDRLDFESGSAVLKPSSAEQLKNIDEILKAYPKVTLKLGGHTDNAGSSESNLKLSQQRAETTRQELIKLGIDAKRLEAEGYGEQHPIADNATEEGKQKNRRIDLRVTNK